MSVSRPALTVEELNEYVRRSLAGDPMLRGVRLRGEVSNFKRHVSGHWYFTLKDGQSAIACAMFRAAATQVAFAPRDGLMVVLTGNVGLYVKTGSYQFYADAMEPDGVGELHLRMEALKNKLQKEGLFDPSLKKPLPLLPRGVGIVTSGTGAVIHDIMRVSWRRYPGMPLYLYPVAVQGEGAVQQIVQALAVLDRLDAVDTLIVGRGGGSIEDLWAFNEEAVARAIAACRKPVVSAVGHETDFTIADFVADVRAPTPSAAAEMAVPPRDALARETQKLMERAARAAEAGVARRAEALANLRGRLAGQSPQTRVQAVGERAAALAGKLATLADARLMELSHRLRETTVHLTAASPAATLSRGYAMVTQGGRLVPGIAALHMGAAFTVTLRDGAVTARAVDAEKEETP